MVSQGRCLREWTPSRIFQKSPRHWSIGATRPSRFRRSWAAMCCASSVRWSGSATKCGENRKQKPADALVSACFLEQFSRGTISGHDSSLNHGEQTGHPHVFEEGPSPTHFDGAIHLYS